MKKVTEDGEIIDEVTHEVIAIAPPFWKTPWNHDTMHESDACALTCRDKSKAQQQFAADADINNILKDPKTFADYVDHCVTTGDIDPLRELGLANARPPEPATPTGGTPAPVPPAGAPSAPTTPATPATSASQPAVTQHT